MHKGIIYKVKWDFESLVLPFTSFRIKIAIVAGIVSIDMVVSIQIVLSRSIVQYEIIWFFSWSLMANSRQTSQMRNVS